jgi:hypothetical protein
LTCAGEHAATCDKHDRKRRPAYGRRFTDDEQLPETLATVAAVPQQKSARRSTPTITNLIDDDPEAPF